MKALSSSADLSSRGEALENIRSLSEVDVCFLAGTLGQGGAERQLFYVLQALVKAGARVRLLTLAQGEFYESRIRDLGVPVTWVGSSSRFVGRLRAMIRAIRETGPLPRFIQSQHFYTNLYASLTARWLGLREIGSMRSDGASDVRSVPGLPGRICLSLPRRIAANSPVAIRYAAAQGVAENRLHWLPNAIDTSVFAPRPRTSSREFRILAAARLSREKRLDLFIRSIARLRAEWKLPVSGIVAGDGPLRRDLEQLSRDLGLGHDAIQFRGAVSDMASVYAEADLLLMTSEYEGTPNVILEAMASQVPVVATGVGGIPFLVEHDSNGQLLSPNPTEEEVCRVVASLIHDPALRQRLASQAFEKVHREHSLQALPGHLLRLYQWGNA